MVFINDGRNRICKDSVGGINKIYLFKHVNYSRSQITLNNNILTSYPATTIYEFQVDNEPSVSQKQNEQSGGKFYELDISLDLVRESGYVYQSFLNFDFNIIIKDRNGNFRFLGNRNGLTCETVNYSVGNGKSDFNGVKLSFTGQEEKDAWYINNLSAAGFTIDGEDINEYLLQENGDFILQEDGFKIIL
jgi:hypothetical protein